MRILLFSCHLILEYNLLKMWTDLGYECFSYGAYQVGNGNNGMRPEIPGLYQDENLKALSIQSSKENPHPEILSWANVIVMMHNTPVPGNPSPQPWLEASWDAIKKSKKPCVFYSIGQSAEGVEKCLEKYRKEGLLIVRYSPKEENIPHYQGSDALIRFAEDPTEFGDYQGITPRIVNVSQALFGDIESGGQVRSRGDHMNLPEFKRIVDGLDWKVFGPNNDDAGEHNGGLLTYTDLRQMLSFNRVFLYLGTRPASYSLGLMEAMMAGIPVVAIGPTLANDLYRLKTYEVHEIIGESGYAGFWSDSVHELREYCKMLLDDVELARKVGAAGRARAIDLFGKDKIAGLWDDFLEKL